MQALVQEQEQELAPAMVQVLQMPTLQELPSYFRQYCNADKESDGL